jgi:hypothetical protein
MSMEHWWNDTDRGNWSTGRKTLYIVDGIWMNEYRALVEWYWQGKLKYWDKNIIQRRWQMNEWVLNTGGLILTGEIKILGDKHYTPSVVDEWMSMEHWWNDTDWGNWSTWRKALFTVGGRWMEQWWNDTDRGNWITKTDLFMYHFVLQKSDMGRPGIEPGPMWRVGD